MITIPFFPPIGMSKYALVSGFNRNKALLGQYLHRVHFIHPKPSDKGFSFLNAARLVSSKCMKDAIKTSDDEIGSKRNFLKDKKLVPESGPPSSRDLDLLYNFVQDSQKLVVLTGAGMSTECGIPDYRSPHGAYSSGFKPITHQEYIRSAKTQRRYWARSYAGWRRFIAAQPGPAYRALASLERRGRVYGMVTQNVDRLHHKAGSNPIELHGSTHSVICLDCGSITCRYLFQDRVKALNPEWALAIESLENGVPGSDGSFGMQQRPDGDIEINERFWEDNFHIPSCEQCGGVLKPNVVFFGDNIPKERADKAMAMVKGGDALLVLGSSLMTMSAYRLVRHCSDFNWACLAYQVCPSNVHDLTQLKASLCESWEAREAGLNIAIVNIGPTRADELTSLKIEARCGEVLPRLLAMGSLEIPVCV